MADKQRDMMICKLVFLVFPIGAQLFTWSGTAIQDGPITMKEPAKLDLNLLLYGSGRNDGLFIKAVKK